MDTVILYLSLVLIATVILCGAGKFLNGKVYALRAEIRQINVDILEDERLKNELEQAKTENTKALEQLADEKYTDQRINKEQILSVLNVSAVKNKVEVTKFYEGGREKLASLFLESYTVSLKGDSQALAKTILEILALSPVHRVKDVTIIATGVARLVPNLSTNTNLLEYLTRENSAEKGNLTNNLNTKSATLSFTVEYYYQEGRQ